MPSGRHACLRHEVVGAGLLSVIPRRIAEGRVTMSRETALVLRALSVDWLMWSRVRESASLQQPVL
jgi:hypothetical protein